MYGLMSHVPQNIVAITPVWHLSLSLIFACNTVLERNMIWGYNFQQYAKTLDANTSTNIFDKVKANTFIKLIDFKPATRRLLANIRLGGVLLLNILGACLHLRGHYRYLGIATSMGYFAAQTTQVYFQARKANDVKQVQQPELNALDDNRIENQNKRQQTEKYGNSGPNR